MTTFLPSPFQRQGASMLKLPPRLCPETMA